MTTGINSSDSLSSLLCGFAESEGIAKIALTQLSKSINQFSQRSIGYLNSPDSEEIASFGAFCARALLENSCAAIVGRLDTFRMLYLSEFQSQPEYELSKRAKSAFSWAGDVMPDEKASTHLWNTEHDIQKISRALFSKHMDHVYWKHAVGKAVDFARGGEMTPQTTDLLSLDPENYLAKTRGFSAQLYSILSKGVHWEFFSSSLIFDNVTIKTHLRDTLVLVGQLGYISHFIPTAYASLTKAEAFSHYRNFRENVL